MSLRPKRGPGSNVGSDLRIGIAFVVSYFTGRWEIFASQISSEAQRERAKIKKEKARREYNEQLKDRL